MTSGNERKLFPYQAVSLVGLYCCSLQRSELFLQWGTADPYLWVRARQRGRTHGWMWNAAWWKLSNSPPQTQASTESDINRREKHVGASEARLKNKNRLCIIKPDICIKSKQVRLSYSGSLTQAAAVQQLASICSWYSIVQLIVW